MFGSLGGCFDDDQIGLVPSSGQSIWWSLGLAAFRTLGAPCDGAVGTGGAVEQTEVGESLICALNPFVVPRSPMSFSLKKKLLVFSYKNCMC